MPARDLSDRAEVEALRDALSRWAADRGRDLPWRATRDPWLVLVSEVMLQQTQVARVVPAWTDFVERYPTVEACADAPVADIIRCWAGLGYNRRAVFLHQAAAAVVERHGGRFPAELTALLALPGVGPYTARALLAFAFERDVAVVDTNVGRILARVVGHRLAPAEAQARADALVPSGGGWAWNQAMLDLGATVCTARTPGCEACPLRPWCRWAAVDGPHGGAAVDPAVGSAGVSGRQSRFEGSDRQGRARLTDALRQHGSVPVDALAAAAGWPDDPERAVEVAASLVADGLARDDGAGGLVLP